MADYRAHAVQPDRAYRLTVPARINVLGNPADANEGDFAAISVAIDLHAGATIKPADGIVLQKLERKGSTLCIVERRCYQSGEIPLPYRDGFDLVKGAINRLFAFSAEYRAKGGLQGACLSTWSDVPPQSGLGGSSLLVLLTLAGLRAFYGLNRRVHNDYILAELAQRVEGKELGITCGFADRYIPLFGGVAYVDYRGKLYHHDIGQEPLATYERLDNWVNDLPLILISSGIARDSGDVHGQMRPRYLEEHAAWLDRGGEPPPMVRLMTAAWETAWRGKIALLANDLVTFGALMNRNHQVVNTMMRYCGFDEGAGWANNLLIDAALASGALGAKLTGAGSGGSVFALVPPGQENALMERWERVASKHGLTSAQVYRPRIVRQGLTVEEA